MKSEEAKRHHIEVQLASRYSFDEVLSFIETVGGEDADVTEYTGLLHSFKQAVKDRIPDYMALLFDYMQSKHLINNRRARKIRLASKEPLNKMPLLINEDDPYIAGMAKWRLKNGY